MGKARSNAPASAIINGLCKFRVACRKGNHRRSWRARNCTSFAMPPSDQGETKAAGPGAGVRIALSRGPSPDGAMLSIEHWLEMGRRNSRDTRLRKQGGRIQLRTAEKLPSCRALSKSFSLRPNIGIAARAARRWDDRCLAGVRRGRADLRVNTGRGTQHPVRFRKLIAERLVRPTHSGV